MSLRDTEKALVWIIRAGVYIIPFLVLIISGSTFFPFITAKNIFFRIIVEFITAAWIGLLVINRERYWPKWNIVSMIFSAFIIAVFLSAIFGVDFAHSMWSNFERMEGLVMYFHLAMLFFVLAGTFQSRADWYIIFGVSIAVSFFAALYGLLEFLGAVTSYSDGSRIISTLGNPLYVALYLTFHIFLILYFWFKTNFLWLKWVLSGLFIFEIAVFFLTGSRGAFLGIVAGFGLFFLLWILFGMSGAKRRAIFASLLLLIVLLPFVFISLKNTELIKGSKVFGRFANISLSDNTVQSRFTIWKMALRSFTERPILGWGPGNFIVPYAKYYDPKMFGNEPWFDRTHNMPLEWLTSGGLIVFLLYLALMGSMV
ncbi:MAG: O-antigen ligase family protein, partial [Patescibacteria group bacterium]